MLPTMRIVLGRDAAQSELDSDNPNQRLAAVAVACHIDGFGGLRKKTVAG
jgi:hypothetical protein